MALAVTLCCGVLFTHGQEGVDSSQKPPSAGEIALAVLRSRETAVIEAWRRALREGGPQERAAVARVAHVGRVVALADDLVAALQKESDYHAALEEAAAIAGMTGAERDSVLLETGKRFGQRALAQIAMILARARRAEAITAYLDMVKPALDGEWELAEFFRIATLNDSSGLEPVAGAALQAGDAGLWLALLDASIKSDALLGTGILTSALTHPTSEISLETAWQLATVFADEPPSRPSSELSLMSAVNDEKQSMTSDVDLVMGTRLLARILGRQPVEDKAWMAHLGGSGKSRFDDYQISSTFAQYLTPGERKALKKRLARVLPTLKLPDPPSAAQADPIARTSPKKRPQVVRMANGFPPGFVEDAAAASGCSMRAGLVLGKAEVSYDDLGRPLKVSLLMTPPPPKCTALVTALFASTLKPINDFSGTENPQTLFLVLEKGYLSRLEQDSDADPEAAYINSDNIEAAPVQAPRRVHMVKPVYPATAQAGRKVGKVIVELVVNRDGLVSDLRLLKQNEPAFVASVFVSVAQWRYKPATQGGKPIRVYMTIIVDYDLR